MFVSKHAGDYIAKMSEEAVYEESPYSQYQRMATLGRSEGRKTSQGMGSFESSKVESEEDFWEEKAHRFKTHTFRVASYCDYCRNFMWGLVQQGLKCEDCGFAAHKRCAERSRMDCQPHLRYVKRIFAVDLTTLCMAHKCPVPSVLLHCVGEIEKRGLNVEGLYRVSGSHEEVAKLRNLYDTQSNRLDWLEQKLARVDDIHSIASLLKLYLRLLPLPLIPLPVSRALLTVMRTQSGRVEGVKQILHQQLSSPHHATLKVLLSHLAKVAAASTQNKMSAENIARIFAPTLLCAASPQASNPSPIPVSAQTDHQLLHFLITSQHLIYQ